MFEGGLIFDQITPEKQTLAELKFRLQTLRKNGPITVEGQINNNSYGLELERRIGLKNNNKASSDWGEYELKTSINRASTVTLATLNWEFEGNYNLAKLCRDHGKQHFSKHLQCPTIRLDSAIPFSNTSVKELHVCLPNEEGLLLRHGTTNLAKIELAALEKSFYRKFSNLVFISLEKLEASKDKFNIETITVCRKSSFQKFLDEFKLGNIWVEFQCFLIKLDTPEEGFKTKTSSLKTKSQSLFSLFEQIEVC